MLQLLPPAPTLFHKVGVDLWTKIDCSDQMNFVAIEQSTKYAETKSLLRATAPGVGQFLLEGFEARRLP